jgi:hypothetical protein
MTGLGALLAAALLAQGAPAADRPAETAAAAAKPEKPKKVCVEEAQMGSHFKKRICATPEEWEKRRAADTAAMSKRGANAPVCSGPGC